MAGWLSGRLDRQAGHAIEREMREYLAFLRGGDGEELALLVALAAHVRNTAPPLLQDQLHAPLIAVANDPSLPLQITRAIRSMQRQGQFAEASGWMIWALTMRAALRPELRFLGKQIWLELERGFPMVREATMDHWQLTGVRLIDLDACEFPEGFNPHR